MDALIQLQGLNYQKHSATPELHQKSDNIKVVEKVILKFTFARRHISRRFKSSIARAVLRNFFVELPGSIEATSGSRRVASGCIRNAVPVNFFVHLPHYRLGKPNELVVLLGTHKVRQLDRVNHRAGSLVAD